MNKIVYEHVAALEVPERFRGGIPDAATVRVTVEVESAYSSRDRESLKALVTEARQRAEGVTTEEAVARIRALRDEWDH